MARGRAVAIVLDDAERGELSALTRKHGAPQALAERARIVLAAASGLNNKEIAAKVGREAFHKGGLHAALHNGYWNPRNDAALFELTIVEPTIEQHIALILHRREEGSGYVLKYATFGMPRPTEGMHFATKALAEWIVGLHPDGEIIAESIKA